MGIGPADLESILSLRCGESGWKCAVLGDCTFWYPGGSLEDFRDLCGFDSVETFDINGQPTYRVDLQEQLSSSLHDRYDFVIDAGTLYCVFDVASVMRNVLLISRVGSISWHQLNLVGHFGRGYWSVGPAVMYEFYTQNGYDPIATAYYVKERGDRWVYFDQGAHNLRSASSNSFEFVRQKDTWRHDVPCDSSLLFVARRVTSVPFVKPVPRHYIETNGR